eukprot:jgi/Undpi1/8042/HiC_scaffold_24.g10514.m1
MLDVLFAAAVPMIVGGVARGWSRLHPKIFGFFAHWLRWGWDPMFVRTVEYEKHVIPGFTNEDDGTDERQRNNILHRAILLYMGQVYGGTSEQLKAYSINVTPPKKAWVPLTDGVFFFQPRTRARRLARCETAKVTFMFASNKADGDLRIQDFMNKAFLWYCKAMESTEDHFRYYYTPLTDGPTGPKVIDLQHQGERAIAMEYKRYRLGNEKGFDTLFFPEKELLLKILHNFQHKTGQKYGIKGYPHKLGLLLHGPPGTGKSSLIKALALHTERHVIDVPLARIKTNQDLMDIMFDQNFPVDKQDFPVTLAVENVIFVMEDVDATSPVVRSRGLDGDTLKPAQPKRAGTTAKGLLNVLDGVVDSPGRIVIMTTNFPDALDAALIRPGRVDKMIHLGYMKYDAAQAMTRHFFEVDHLTVDQDQRLRSIFGDGGGGGGGEAGEGEKKNITPAVVEQLAGEFDTVDEFIVALEAI